ncbi:MAG: hypothetical protein J2P57_09640 [Acidimicrobiaceae bacterium]|nr:hypothetical protein [Acidimicrobiaceae bacterium]
MPDDADPGSEIAEAFARWAAAERAAGAASERTRERWLRQQAADAASLIAVLVDLAERGSPVVVRIGGTAGDLRGHLVGVGQDFVVLQDHAGAATMVALPAIDLFAIDGEHDRAGSEPAADNRTPTVSLDLVGALTDLAADRAPVRLRLAGGQIVVGDLLGVGTDVLWMREHTSRHSTLYVPVGAVLACTPS